MTRNRQRTMNTCENTPPASPGAGTATCRDPEGGATMARRSGARRLVPRALGRVVPVCIALLSACAPLDDEQVVVEGDEAALVRNDVEGGLPTREAVSSTQGTFRHVMRIGGCTGSLVRPFAAITAQHCGANTNSVLGWSDVEVGQVRKVYHNPYLTYRPAWWVELDNQQRAAGGRIGDWPAMHDHTLVYSPDLTPTFISERSMMLPSTDPELGLSYGEFRTVGLASGSRDSGLVQFLPATAGSITDYPRDGYLTRDGATAGYVQTRAGDSGGPSYAYGGFFGSVLVGTTQNAVGGQEETSTNTSGSTFGGDIAPLAYTPGMTANQLLTVKLNSQWLNARLSDIDDDGFAEECDLEPGAVSSYGRIGCNAPRAQVYGTAQEPPMARVVCKPGYDVVGYGGRAGWLVDSLALLCAKGSEVYWTDHFGADTGGNAFFGRCPVGQTVQIWNLWESRSAPVTDRLNALQPVCGTTILTPMTSLTTAGNDVGKLGYGTKVSANCQPGERLSGFLARRDGGRWITSVAAICTKL